MKQEKTMLLKAEIYMLILCLICLHDIPVHNGIAQLERVEILAHANVSLNQLRRYPTVVVGQRDEKLVKLGCQTAQVRAHMLGHHHRTLAVDGSPAHL